MKVKFFAGLLSYLVLSSPLLADIPPSSNVVAQDTKTVVNPINLNDADVNALSKSMKGIGLKRAEAIVKFREAHNGFKSINDLSQVPGLGKNFVNAHLEELQRLFIIK